MLSAESVVLVISSSAMVVAGVVEHVRELVGRGRGELGFVIASFEKSHGELWSVQASVGPTAITSPPPAGAF